MQSTLNVTKAQANFPSISKGKRIISVEDRGKLRCFIVPRAQMEALLETLEILGNPDAMKTIRADRAGKLKYHDFDEAQG